MIRYNTHRGQSRPGSHETVVGENIINRLPISISRRDTRAAIVMMCRYTYQYALVLCTRGQKIKKISFSSTFQHLQRVILLHVIPDGSYTIAYISGVGLNFNSSLASLYFFEFFGHGGGGGLNSLYRTGLPKSSLLNQALYATGVHSTAHFSVATIR